MHRLIVPATAALMAVAAAAPAFAQQADTQGEITKIDKAAQKVTIKHGEIKSLDMPPMTMAFRLANAQMLEGLNVGDRVRFGAAKVDGVYTVTVIVRNP